MVYSVVSLLVPQKELSAETQSRVMVNFFYDLRGEGENDASLYRPNKVTHLRVNKGKTSRWARHKVRVYAPGLHVRVYTRVCRNYSNVDLFTDVDGVRPRWCRYLPESMSSGRPSSGLR